MPTARPGARTESRRQRVRGLAKQIKASPHQSSLLPQGSLGAIAGGKNLYRSSTVGQVGYRRRACIRPVRQRHPYTDTHKEVARNSPITFNQTQVILAGVAKGAGMIHPNIGDHAGLSVHRLSASPARVADMPEEAADRALTIISKSTVTPPRIDTTPIAGQRQSGVPFKSVRTIPGALTKVCRVAAGQIVADGEA